LLVCPQITDDILAAWDIDPNLTVEAF